MNLTRTARKYIEVMLVTAQSSLAYPIEAFARSGFMALVIFVFAQLWTVTFQISGRTSVGGFDLNRMIWYLVLTETIIMSCPRIFSKIDQEVKSGDLAYVLNRPYDYGLFQYAAYLGNALLTLPVNFAVGAGLAFWFEDTYAFYWIYQKIVFTLGGLFLPLDAFPRTLRTISSLLPFTSIAYGPARLTAGYSGELLLSTIGTQLVWLAVLGLMAALVYRGGVRRLNVNGG